MTSVLKDNQKQNYLSDLCQVIKKKDYYELIFKNNEIGKLYIINDEIFRLVIQPKGKEELPSVPFSCTQIKQNQKDYFELSKLLITEETFIIRNQRYSLRIQKKPALISIFDERTNHYRMKQKQPLLFQDNCTTETLTQNDNEFYFGCGMQNGHFSHKGNTVQIKNTNLTGLGAVACPINLFWSTAGFSELRNTWSNGIYDFGQQSPSYSSIMHFCDIFDNFYILGDNPAKLLANYYQISGQPLFLPKFALNLGYISDLSSKKVDDTSDIAIHKQNWLTAIEDKIKLFAKKEFPLSWIIPDFKSKATFDINSTKNLSEYNINFGSENLRDNGTFGIIQLPMNNTDNLTIIDNLRNMHNQLDHQNQRIWLMTNNGWAGIHTYSATVNGGVGGEWEELSAQITSFLGLSLSGQPNFGNALDGEYGGGNAQVNLRDLQWKIFTPLLFNMDGEGNIEKTPFAFNNKITKINKAYFNLRKRLTYYLYNLLKQAQDGFPMIRPLCFNFPRETYNYTTRVNKEFMLGDSLLIAPITNGRENHDGLSIKDNIYLPDDRTVWIDPFTGKKFPGGLSYDQLTFSSWHLPVFIKQGSIIPNNLRDANIFPCNQETAILYDDDGISRQYQNEQFATTKIDSSLQNKTLVISIAATQGDFDKLDLQQPTYLTIFTDNHPQNIIAKRNNEVINLVETNDIDTLDDQTSGFSYIANFNLWPEFSEYTQSNHNIIRIKLVSQNIKQDHFELTINNFTYCNDVQMHAITDSALIIPKDFEIMPKSVTSKSMTVHWSNIPTPINDHLTADIELNGIIHTNISGNIFTLHELQSNTRYRLRIRNRYLNKVSEWSENITGKTNPDPLEYAVKDIKISANLESTLEMPLVSLIDFCPASEWLSKEKITTNNPLILTINFDQIYKLSRMVYIPRSRDHKGHILKIRIAISKDGLNYSEWSAPYDWNDDAKNKVIGLRDVVAKSIKLHITDAVDGVVSGKELLFFKAK